MRDNSPSSATSSFCGRGLNGQGSERPGRTVVEFMVHSDDGPATSLSARRLTMTFYNAIPLKKQGFTNGWLVAPIKNVTTIR